jgi:hypothetical protein
MARFIISLQSYQSTGAYRKEQGNLKEHLDYTFTKII